MSEKYRVLCDVAITLKDELVRILTYGKRQNAILNKSYLLELLSLT